MAEFDLNLSTKPFPAYRLINIALVCVLIVLVVVSVVQSQGFARFSRLSGSIRSEEQESRVEAQTLQKQVSELESRLDRPESTAKLNEISFLNRLILRKKLSWTKLFRILEATVPENVHLTSLAPEIAGNGNVTLRLGVRARSIADASKFVERLETSKLFENVHVSVEEKTDPTVSTDVDLTLSSDYYPDRDGQ
jgi:Tfp pilus assembly protein PilN